MLFVIASPDVYKSPNSETYIVFGEAKIEDMSQQAQLAASSQLGGSGGGGLSSIGKTAKPPADDDEDVPDLEPADEGEVDETGVDPKDIDLVVQQVGCSRGKAVRALKESGGDLINASKFSMYSLQLFSSVRSRISHLQSWLPASDLSFVPVLVPCHA